MNNLGRGNENHKDGTRILTRETFGIVLELFAILALVILLTRSAVFGPVGFAISSFLLGVFGYCAYAALAALVYVGAVLITGKRLAVRRRMAVAVALAFVCLVCLVHTITADVAGIAYGAYGPYLGDCYKAGENSFFQTTGGGVIFGLVVYPVVKLTTSVGGYIIFSLLLIGSGYLVYAAAKNLPARRRKNKAEGEAQPAPVPGFAADTSGVYDWNYAPAPEGAQGAQPAPSAPAAEYGAEGAPAAESAAERSKRLFVLGDEFDMKTRRELRQDARREQQAQARQQRAPEPPAPPTPYSQSHSILYPQNNGESYDWYAERFGGGHVSAPSPKKAAEPAPYGSYTNNRIFDKDSYFNRPDRGISAEQYSAYFRGPSAYAEGHERTTPRTSAPAPAEAAPSAPPAPAATTPVPTAGTYSAVYEDAESKISYSAIPKKIVTDATEEPRRDADFYRNDVTPSAAARPSAAPAQPRRIAGEESVDVRAAARRAGFGDFDRHAPEETTEGSSLRRDPPRAESAAGADALRGEPAIPSRDGLRSEPAIPSRDSLRSEAAPSRERAEEMPARDGLRSEPVIPSRDSLRSEPAVPSRENLRSEAAPSCEEEEPPARESLHGEASVPSRESLRGEAAAPRASREREEISADEEEGEERSGLQPVPPALDTAVDLFGSGEDEEEEPAVSAVTEAAERTRLSAAPAPKAEEPRKKHVYARYNPPPLDLLNDYTTMVTGGDETEEVEHNKEIIVETLYNLKVQSEVVQVTRGPAVTRYDIDIPGNIPASRVLGCDTELAMRLHAKDGVNIQPNYESGTISIEVPNQIRDNVGLREVIDTREFSSARPNSLTFGLGKDIEGRVILGDITKMIHLLVAGSTGAGKSVCLNALIISLLCRYSPEDLRIILVDPKQVEFNIYDKLPHLMINEIINEPSKVINVLNWCINEMERRYSLFKQKTKSEALVRDIDEFNAHLKPDEEKLPKIVIIIDELADLMSAAKKEIEDRIQRLTQKSRAAGIHMVLATQRPSVNVITGVIKTNLPTRIAFKVTSGFDSQTILDTVGAEKLLGKGDMLYKADAMPFPLRVQGAFLSSDEVQRVVEYVKEHNEAYFDDRVADFVNNRGGGGGEGGDDDGVEAVYIEALRNVVDIGQASISMIQRRCSVGYPKAGKIIEWMENMGYISAFDGAKARKVLLTKEEFESKYGDYGE